MSIDQEYIKGLEKTKKLDFSADGNVAKLLGDVLHLESSSKDIVEQLQPKPVVVTDPDEAYCRIIAKYLNDNYINIGVWNGGPSKPWMSKTDEKAMEEGYKSAVKFVVDRHEAALWLEVKQYFNLAKVNTKQRKPTWNRVKEILKYKTVDKTKRAVRKYLYS